MRQYSGSRTIWHTNDGRNIPVRQLTDAHLAAVINFVRWDACKDLFPGRFKGPFSFDFSRLDARERGEVVKHLYEHLITWPELVAVAQSRKIFEPNKNIELRLFSLDIETTAMPWDLRPGEFIRPSSLKEITELYGQKSVSYRRVIELEQQIKKLEARLDNVERGQMKHDKQCESLDRKMRAAFAKMDQNVKDDVKRHDKLDQYLNQQVSIARTRFDNHHRRISVLEEIARESNLE